MSDSDRTNTNISEENENLDSLIFKFGNLGKIAIEPSIMARRDLPFIDYLIFPRPIPDSKISSAHLWVESRECPIFCVKDDLDAFQKAGFGPHKFNLVDGYREVSVEGGAVSFFPAAQEKHLGMKGLLFELLDAWGLRPIRSYHLKLKTRNSEPLLVLANPILERIDVKILCEEKPAKIIALPGYPEADWKKLEKLFGMKIYLYHEALNRLNKDPRYFSPADRTQEASI
jgi:hypothetical protein